MRTAVAALVDSQSRIPASDLPRRDAAALAADLAGFERARAARSDAAPWTDTDRGRWQRICGLLIGSALAQPQVALRGPVGPDDGAAVIESGPITHDLARLLRDSPSALDESQEIDLAVRWWEAARRAGLPVDTDFGEVWRALEWTLLLADLTALGRLPAGVDGSDPGVQQICARASRVALRYGPLKPMLDWLAPWSGAKAQSGYTF